MDIRHIIAVFNIVCFAVTIMTMESKDFHLISNDKETISPLGRSWRLDSRLACAVACIKNIPLCNSFIYNTQYSSCMLGSLTTVVHKSRNVTTQLLYTYTEPFCQKNQGFSLYSNINGTICFWFPPSGVISNFTEADKYCKDRQLQLVTIKTLQKLYLFLDAVQMLNLNFNFWIGLNDMEQEDTFRWTDDNTRIAERVRNVLFSKGEPKNYENNEDCVEYSISLSPCNDARCSEKRRFSCEALPGEQINL